MYIFFLENLLHPISSYDHVITFITSTFLQENDQIFTLSSAILPSILYIYFNVISIKPCKVGVVNFMLWLKELNFNDIR